MEDVKRLAVRLRVYPDRARLKRELLGAQGLTHAQERRARLLADGRFYLLGGLRRGHGDGDEANDTAGQQSAENRDVSELHGFVSFSNSDVATSRKITLKRQGWLCTFGKFAAGWMFNFSMAVDLNRK